MKKVMFILIGLLTIIVFYFVAILLTDPVSKHDKERIADILELAYEQAGIENPSWQTLVVAATREVDLSREQVWLVWENLEAWPTWSGDLHQSAQWKGPKRWEAGAEFEQLLNLGFPIGTQVSEERISEALPQQRVVWAKNKDGIRACHVWDFTTLPNGKTRVTNCEVFHGAPIAIVSPFAAKNWYKKFNTGMDNLIEQASN